jgi:hypothetical protein
MRTLGMILLAVVIGQLAVGGRALAAQGAPTPAPAAPLDPYNAPPPGYGSAPPAYAPPAMTPVQSLMMYEATKKNAGLAVVLEFFVPGLGSLYGDHAVGSLITWALMIAGIAMVIYGATQWVESYDSMNMTTQKRDNSAGTFGLTAGLVLLIGGRVYGLVDSYLSTEDYNKKLKARYGLPVVINFGVGRVGGGQAMSLGPRLSIAF